MRVLFILVAAPGCWWGGELEGGRGGKLPSACLYCVVGGEGTLLPAALPSMLPLPCYCQPTCCFARYCPPPPFLLLPAHLLLRPLLPPPFLLLPIHLLLHQLLPPCWPCAMLSPPYCPACTCVDHPRGCPSPGCWWRPGSNALPQSPTVTGSSQFR